MKDQTEYIEELQADEKVLTEMYTTITDGVLMYADRKEIELAIQKQLILLYGKIRTAKEKQKQYEDELKAEDAQEYYRD